MKRLLFFLALFTISIASAQHDEAYVDALVAQKMAELEMQDNPQYFFRKDYCIGNVQMFTLPNGALCTSRSTYYSVYVFWKEGDNLMKIQKFDNCGSFKPFTVEMGKALSKALKNKQALQSGEVLPYKGEQQDPEAFGNMSVQSCHKQYKFVFDESVFEKHFREYDLTNDSKYRNVNAAHNNSLELIKLDTLLSEMVKNLEEKGKFFRES